MPLLIRKTAHQLNVDNRPEHLHLNMYNRYCKYNRELTRFTNQWFKINISIFLFRLCLNNKYVRKIKHNKNK